MAGPTTITTPVTGTTISTTSFGNPVSADINFLIAPPIFLGYQSAAQSIPNNAFTAITFDTEVVDSYGGHSTVSNTSRYTAQVAGWYDVIGKVSWVANATGRRIATLYVNGSELAYTRGEGIASATAVAASCYALAPVFLNATDYVEVYGLQNSGGALNTGASPTTLAVRWVHT